MRGAIPGDTALIVSERSTLRWQIVKVISAPVQSHGRWVSRFVTASGENRCIDTANLLPIFNPDTNSRV